MKNNKFDEACKSKDDQQVVVATLSSSVKQIHHVADTNQQKLQQLELAIANLTTICSAIRHDMYSLSSSSSSNQAAFKARAEAVQYGSRSCSPRLNSKNDVLGVQMQQLVKQAAALGIHKDSNTNSVKFSGKTKAESKAPTKAVRKNVQASKTQKSSTKSLIQKKQSTTERKTCMKQETVNNNNMVATQPKAQRAPENNNVKKANNTTTTTTTKNTGNVSLKSTVKSTKTTVSKVYVNQSVANKSNKVTTVVKNGETAQGKGQKVLPKYHGLTNRSSSSGVADSEIRHPRKKWSTAKQVSLTNSK